MPNGLLGIEDLTREEIEAILNRAKDFQPAPGQSFRQYDTLRGKMVVLLFLEPSTRTRTSFEIAARRLGGDPASISGSGSSLSKGESLVDTLNTVAAMRPDAIVMRHKASGAPHFLARYLNIPIINAGDGTHEHPTQALLDARTILDRKSESRGAAGGDYRRHRTQPRGAVEHLPAVEIRSRHRAVRTGAAGAARAGRDCAGRHHRVRHAQGDQGRRRDHDAAGATGAAARDELPARASTSPSTGWAWNTWTWPRPDVS